MSDDGFSQFLAAFLWRRYQIKFLHASIKSLTNCENPSSNLFQGACSCFPEAACDLKSCSESRLRFWKLFRKPAMNENWRKSTNDSEEKLEQKFDAAYGTIFRIS